MARLPDPNEAVRDVMYRVSIRSIAQVLLDACPRPNELRSIQQTARHLAGNEAACVVAIRRWADVDPRETVTPLQRHFAYKVATGIEALLLPEHEHILTGLINAGRDDDLAAQ